MATDFDGRRVVNLSIAETFKVSRPSLVSLRAQTGLNYGGVFVAEELMRDGMSTDDIVAKLKTGSIDELASQHLDWKRVTDDAKKLNASVDENLYQFFMGKKATAAQDNADKYDVHYDGVKADSDVSKQEISSAQDRYLKWRDRAAAAHAKDHKGMSYGDERLADMDHVAGGGPQGGGRGQAGEAGTQGPTTMGGPH